MQGFQVNLFTEEGRHRGHKPVHVWLMDVAADE
jgi:hypothetical protein